ncbi:hypothetical protein D3C75_920740 [compost metagenome]
MTATLPVKPPALLPITLPPVPSLTPPALLVLPATSCSGRIPPSFLSRIMLSAASLRASSRCSALPMNRSAASGSAYGCSNRPSLNFSSSTRCTARSRTSSASLPLRTAFTGCSPNIAPDISMSMPALRACTDASSPSSATSWPAASISIAPQSVMTMPSNPHAPRRMSSSSAVFTVQGTPSISL